MKKLILMVAIAIFFVGILPAVAPQEKHVEGEVVEAEINPIKEQLVEEREFAEIKRKKLQNNEKLEEETVEKFRILEKEQLQEVMKLDEEGLLTLAELDEHQIKKIAGIRINGLRKITSLNEKTIKKLIELDEKQLEKLSVLDRARLKKFSELIKTDLSKELQKIEIKKVDPNLLFKKRIISQQKIRKAEERFQIAKQELLELGKELDNEKKALITAQENGEKKMVEEHAKEYLLIAVDAIISHLEKIKNKIQQSQGIDEEEALGLVKDINLKIKELEDIKSNVESTKTKEEIKNQAKNINSAWKRIRISSEFYVSVLINKKIEETIKRSEQLEKKLESILTEMEESNLNISNIEDMLTEFSEKIDEARNGFKQSIGKFKEAKSTGVKIDLEKKVIEGKYLAKEAEVALKNAHTTLIEIIKNIRYLDETVNLEKEREEEWILAEETEEKDNVNVEVEGFLKIEHQKLVNLLAKTLNQSKTNAEIEVEIKVDYENLELKKEIKGALTENQKDLINELTESLEDIDEKVKIKIQSGKEAGQ